MHHNCKNCLEISQLENKIRLEENKIAIDSFFCYKRKGTEFMKNNKLILNKSKDLEVKRTMFLPKKLIRLLSVQIMLKEYNQLIQ